MTPPSTSPRPDARLTLLALEVVGLPSPDLRRRLALEVGRVGLPIAIERALLANLDEEEQDIDLLGIGAHANESALLDLQEAVDRLDDPAIGEELLIVTHRRVRILGRVFERLRRMNELYDLLASGLMAPHLIDALSRRLGLHGATVMHALSRKRILTTAGLTQLPDFTSQMLPVPVAGGRGG
jgi:hypothetical protein